MSERESFYAMRRTDGEPIFGDCGWMTCDGPDDWMLAGEADHDDPTEYELVRMVVEPVARRTFGVAAHEDVGGECSWCGEAWPCDDATPEED